MKFKKTINLFERKIDTERERESWFIPQTPSPARAEAGVSKSAQISHTDGRGPRTQVHSAALLGELAGSWTGRKQGSQDSTQYSKGDAGVASSSLSWRTTKMVLSLLQEKVRTKELYQTIVNYTLFEYK